MAQVFIHFFGDDPPWAANPFMNALLSEFGWRWVNDDNSPGPVVIKYYFAPGGIRIEDPLLIQHTTIAWTPEQKAAFAAATETWEAVANVKFVEVDSAAEADFVEYAYSDPGSKVLGSHEFPEQTLYENWEYNPGPSVGIYNFGALAMEDLQPDGKGFITLVH